MASSQYAQNKNRSNEKDTSRRNYKSVTDIGEGRNRTYILFSLKLAAYGKVDWSDTEEVRDRITQYFSICAEEDMRPSAAGLALCLGCSREYLYALINGEYRAKKNPELQHMLIMAIQILDAQMVDYMQNNDINPVAGIFLMKNNFGYRDDKYIIHNSIGTDEKIDGKDRKLLEQKYAESVVDDSVLQNIIEENITDSSKTFEDMTMEELHKQGIDSDKPLSVHNLDAEDKARKAEPFTKPIEAEIVIPDECPDDEFNNYDEKKD